VPIGPFNLTAFFLKVGSILFGRGCARRLGREAPRVASLMGRWLRSATRYPKNSRNNPLHSQSTGRPILPASGDGLSREGAANADRRANPGMWCQSEDHPVLPGVWSPAQGQPGSIGSPDLLRAGPPAPLIHSPRQRDWPPLVSNRQITTYAEAGTRARPCLSAKTRTIKHPRKGAALHSPLSGS
jgi:hypothetical protein